MSKTNRTLEAILKLEQRIDELEKNMTAEHAETRKIVEAFKASLGSDKVTVTTRKRNTEEKKKISSKFKQANTYWRDLYSKDPSVFTYNDTVNDIIERFETLIKDDTIKDLKLHPRTREGTKAYKTATANNIFNICQYCNNLMANEDDNLEIISFINADTDDTLVAELSDEYDSIAKRFEEYKES